MKFKIVTALILSLLPFANGHDKSKCVENGKYDNDCCAIKGSARCKDGYKLSWGKVCYDGGSWKAHSYFCNAPASPQYRSAM